MLKRARISLPWYSWIFIDDRLRERRSARTPPARPGRAPGNVAREIRVDARTNPSRRRCDAAAEGAGATSADVVVDALRGGVADASHQAANELRGEAAREQEARLRRVLRG